jgi:hypothetical protein
VGAFCAYEGEDEGPGWAGADRVFWSRRDEISNRADSLVLGFLYRPHTDHPEIPAEARACFVGAEVTTLDRAPAGMASTRFPGGQYVMMDVIGDTADETAQGVGEAIGFLCTWMAEHGYVEGDACFSAGDEKAVRPPHVETVYIHIKPAA